MSAATVNNPKSTKKPATPEAAARGRAFRALLKRLDIGISDFVEVTGISRASINRYLTGDRDLATVEQEIADKILRGTGIADGEAWEIIGIPVEHRGTFRSFRPPPLGHGAILREHTDLRLDAPLFGSVALPAGTLIRLSDNGPEMAHRIYRMTDGRLFAVSGGVQIEGELLGGLVSAHFAIVQ